jgi:hypothetical protein
MQDKLLALGNQYRSSKSPNMKNIKAIELSLTDCNSGDNIGRVWGILHVIRQFALSAVEA